MEITSHNLKTNFKQNNYLYNCDSINKYAIKSIYQKPEIQKIVINFPVDQLKKAGIGENERTAFLKSFFVLYLLFFFKPFCKYSVIENKRLKLETINEKIDLKITLTDKEEITFFLRTLFVENWERALEENFNLFNSKEIFLDLKKDKINFSKKTSVSCYSFFEVDQFLKKMFNRINTKEIFFDINFHFSNIKTQHSKTCIKTIPFFWING